MPKHEPDTLNKTKYEGNQWVRTDGIWHKKTPTPTPTNDYDGTRWVQTDGIWHKKGEAPVYATTPMLDEYSPPGQQKCTGRDGRQLVNEGLDEAGALTAYLKDAEQDARAIRVKDGLIRRPAFDGQGKAGPLRNADSTEAFSSAQGSKGQFIWAMAPNGRIIMADAREEMERLNPGLKLGWKGNAWLGQPTTIQGSDDGMINRVQHSSLLKGAAAGGAGEMRVKQGRLTELSGFSGHYRPNNGFIAQSVRELWRKGVDLNEADIHLRTGAHLMRGFDTVNIRDPRHFLQSPPAWERLLGYSPAFTAKGNDIVSDMDTQEEQKNALFAQIRDLRRGSDGMKAGQLVPSLVAEHQAAEKAARAAKKAAKKAARGTDESSSSSSEDYWDTDSDDSETGSDQAGTEAHSETDASATSATEGSQHSDGEVGSAGSDTAARTAESSAGGSDAESSPAASDIESPLKKSHGEDRDMRRATDDESAPVLRSSQGATKSKALASSARAHRLLSDDSSSDESEQEESDDESSDREEARTEKRLPRHKREPIQIIKQTNPFMNLY